MKCFTFPLEGKVVEQATVYRSSLRLHHVHTVHTVSLTMILSRLKCEGQKHGSLSFTHMTSGGSGINVFIINDGALQCTSLALKCSS